MKLSFIVALQDITSQLRSVFLTISLYQVQMIIHFSWYSKCGGVNSGLKFIFHIKDKNGHISNPSLKPIELNTELVYADGSATPFVPLSPLKEKNTAEQAKLYHLVGSYCIISLCFYFTRSRIVFFLYVFRHYTVQHRWELTGNYPVFGVVMVIYHYVQRIWRILVTPDFLYNIYEHEKI